MIAIEGLHKTFGRLEVLNNVNLSFNKGECIALVGPNGCGKTTLIKAILGMVIPSKGKIKVKGEYVSDHHVYRKHIGYMPQIGRYPDNMTVGQILEMIKTIRRSENKIDEDLVNHFELNKLANKRMRTLSGGTTQKVSAILAFLFDPDILILDEPTAGLDPLASEILKEKIIREKQKGKLILITSHLLSELDDLVSHVVFMQEGQVMFHKTTGDLKNSTGEQNIGKAIASVLKKKNHEQNN